MLIFVRIYTYAHQMITMHNAGLIATTPGLALGRVDLLALAPDLDQACFDCLLLSTHFPHMAWVGPGEGTFTCQANRRVQLMGLDPRPPTQEPRLMTTTPQILANSFEIARFEVS